MSVSSSHYQLARRLTRGGHFRWRDRGRADTTPPPPYEESQRSHQQTHDAQALHSETSPTKHQRRRHAAAIGRRAAGSSVRHRKPIPQRLHPTAYSQQPGPSQPTEVHDVTPGPFDFKFGQVEEEGEDEEDDQVGFFLSLRSSSLYAPCADRSSAFFL